MIDCKKDCKKFGTTGCYYHPNQPNTIGSCGWWEDKNCEWVSDAKQESE